MVRLDLGTEVNQSNTKQSTTAKKIAGEPAMVAKMRTWLAIGVIRSLLAGSGFKSHQFVESV